MNRQTNKSLIIAISIMLIASLWRLLPHMPNFSPVLAIALFSSLFIENKRLAVILPIGLMLLSDLFLGFHTSMLAVYLSIFLISLAGFWLRKNFTYLKGIGTIISGSVLFFVVTNLYYWLFSGLYAINIAGLADCYTRAIPFFRTALIGDLVFSVVMYGLYKLSMSFVTAPVSANK